MSDKKYWQSFGEFSESEGFKQSAQNEFREDLPMEASLPADKQGLLDAKTPRRDFLKYLGFSTAAAALAAGCEMPVKKVIPYVNKPDASELIPGVAGYYATTYISGGNAIPVVAKVRDGRPIKLEGNELSSFTKGGTSARVQASVLDLYDGARLHYPIQMVNGDPQEVSTFEAFDKMVGEAMTGLSGSLVLLTSTINSPTTKQIIGEFLAKYPGSKHVQYDADSYSGMLLANEATHGKRIIPSYQFENAKVIVSLGADFLGTWLSPVEFGWQYVQGRKIDAKNPEMSKHYQFESMLSMTGGNADDRYTHRPSEAGAVALALLAELSGGSSSSSSLSPKLKAGISKAAKDLAANKGKALVVSGSNNPNVQIIVNAINEAIGANGTTINWGKPIQTHAGVEADMNALIADMEAGKVGALLIYGVNPVYDYYDGEKFKTALQKIKATVSFNERLDETAELCKYSIPAPHFLERWGDAEPKAGHIAMIQPTINPLFKTRSFEDSLLKWSGNNTSYENYFLQYWTKTLGSTEAYEKALQDGVVEQPTVALAALGFNNAKVAEATAAIGSIKKGGNLELVLYQSVAMGVGNQANNPWLLELPDPITRANWDNYAIVSPKFIKQESIPKKYRFDLSKRSEADKFEVHPDRLVIKIKVGSKEISLPILPVPGTPDNVIAIAVGWGRQSAKPENTSEFIGRSVVGAGKNVFPLISFNGVTAEWSVSDISFEATNETYPVAQAQTHSSYEGRNEVVKELTLEDFKKSPNEILEEREEELKPYGGLEKFEKEGTLYGVYDKPGIHWGMSIDMNSCFGCGACVVACHAENNVAVVGKSEVLRYHDMHWLRIDRYFSGNLEDPDDIQTVFQPMLCQHCDNAPCENVCPVAATNHSSEGLNQMAYNRCIGTRYCANNCPFKVRRFNWADYSGADSFPNNQDANGVGHFDPVVFQMNDDLTRMVLNPDVTVRSRGVMEKCSFCVQRLQDGKLKAKKENRPLKDMEDVRTACQQACPSDAIVFGNVNDSQSMINKTRAENKQRVFYALEELHVLPNVNYLAKVRNTEKISESVNEK
ncbi:MAG: TAT-variant-translocated molybdopterin oxidoreductase [Bacteroidetes bacterium]|nr:TAT-variant-translocated molybdopterin oxidoreductase [Bacteroidota bacterium]